MNDFDNLIAKADAEDADAIEQLIILSNFGHADAILWVEKKATDIDEPDQAYYQYVAGMIYRCHDFEKMDYQKSFNFFEAASKQSPLPLFELGRMYRDGAGTPQDYVQAFNCFKKAAVQIPAAQGALADLYKEGLGVEKDLKKALSLYQEAAKSGDCRSQFNIGLIDFALDKYTEAAVWWTKSAEQGDMQAQCNLAHLYDVGLGVVRDENKAKQLWRQAAKKGCDKSAENLLQHNKLFFEDAFKSMVFHAKAFAALFITPAIRQ